MAFGLYFQNPLVTQESYETLRRRLAQDGDEFPEGGIIHVAGPNPAGGWRVFEVWETEEAALSYTEQRLAPVFAEFGRPAPAPEVWPIHRMLRR